MKPALHISATLCLAGALTACGGGGEEASVQPFEPGEIVTFSATLEDGSVQESHYLMHGVTADGDLLTGQNEQSSSLKISTGPGKRPPLAGVLVALPLESGYSSIESARRLDALRDFYMQLWRSIAERRNDDSDIAAEIGYFETDIAALYEDYRQSGFDSVKDYVAFYEQVGENPFFDAQETVEEELLKFFYATGWSQRYFLETLRRLQWDWPRFLQLMAQRGHGFADLLAHYHAWDTDGGMALSNFIESYVAIQSVIKQMIIDDSPPRPENGEEKPKDNPFFLTKKSLDVNVNSPKQGVVHILSMQDRDVKNYRKITEWRVAYKCPTETYIKGRRGRAQAVIKWRLKYSFLDHKTLPGTYIEDLGMEYFKAAPEKIDFDRDWGVPEGLNLGVASKWLIKSLRVNMEVKNLRNIRTENDPHPGFSVRVKITPGIVFNSPWVSDCQVY